MFTATFFQDSSEFKLLCCQHVHLQCGLHVHATFHLLNHLAMHITVQDKFSCPALVRSSLTATAQL